MRLGRVSGAVWATKKSPALAGQILLRVHTAETDLIAADLVGAGEGDTVLVLLGAAARQESGAPVDAAIVAILDEGEASHVN
jgi:ethanolamine utilization protein EutN